MTYHSAQTLGKYLGKRVKHSIAGDSQLSMIDISQKVDILGLIVHPNSNVPLNNGLYLSYTQNVYPILKDYKALIEPMGMDLYLELGTVVRPCLVMDLVMGPVMGLVMKD